MLPPPWDGADKAPRRCNLTINYLRTMKRRNLLLLSVIPVGVLFWYAFPAREMKRAHRCDLPVYDLQAWAKEHGGKVPDHAAVFRADQETMSWGAFNWKNESL